MGKYKPPPHQAQPTAAQIAAGRSGSVQQIVANNAAAVAASLLAQQQAPPAVIFSPLPLPAPIGPAAPGIVSVTPSVGAGGQIITPLGGVAGVYGPPNPINLSGQNVALGMIGAASVSPASRAASDGWDYFRNTIETIATDAEISFEEIASSGIASGTTITLGEVGLGVTEGMASLEVVGFSAALLLSEYAFGWLVTKVAWLFPNPSIFGWRPLNFIVSGINNFGKQFESSASGLGSTVAGAFIQPVRQFMGLFQRLGNAVASAHNKIAAVLTTHVPEAKSQAISAAATYTDQQLAGITATEEQAIARLRVETARTVADGIVTADRNSAQALAKVEADLVRMLQGDEALLANLATTVTTQVPLEIATAVDRAVATENQRLTATASTLQQQITALQGEVSSLSGSVQSDEALIASAQSSITALQSQSVVDVRSIEQQQAVIDQAKADIATSTKMISQLNGQITGISSTLAPVHAAQLLNTSQLAPFEVVGSVSLPTLLAALSSQLSKLQTKVDTCVVTTCDPQSPNNIKNQLKSMLSLLSAAGEIGFIVQAVHDPQGTANEIAPSLDTIDSGAVATLNALLSL